MKKGLIIIGLALLAVFLFWEGQRKGLNSFALSSSSIPDSSGMAEMPPPEKINKKIQQESLALSSSFSSVSPASVAEAPQQMHLRVKRRGQKPMSEKPLSVDSRFAMTLRENHLFSSTSWKVWAGVRAIPARDFSKQAGEVVVGQYSGYYIVKDDSMSGDERNFQSKKPLVVFDERTGKFGVVPGTVLLTVDSLAAFKNLQSEYSLQVRGEFSHLKLYIVSSSQASYDLNHFVSALQHDPRVQKAELEIVSRNYVKN
ncbi:hypothetical protein B9G69_002875 [Bdellovibrio sp. SKB1291214]|uniref:hypothetical protein n=1 Tax=Bdellovibrio sp. SKB1291214 TaxID=1732569 RepID=UPI000B51B9AB|nr:hypothetical protein [Bdellovibrio sp. SKB1291214]UYL09516.1 hypothetical protein B9G69_002875 [Bdellovibrio sp. SKB1291214]